MLQSRVSGARAGIDLCRVDQVCGAAGEVRLDGRAPDVAAVAAMAEVMAPRGPDGAGDWHDAGVALVHRRLKIIDLSRRGDQPMVDPELGLVIVFNGCIYNHKELREELIEAGYAFRSTSDTEVILKAFHHWGPERFVDHLIGMFAFAIVEPASGRVVLGRDRLGIKPLYLAEVDGAAPLRLHAAGAARRGRWDRHRDRPRRAAPLPQLSLRRAGAPDDPARRAQARAGHAADRRARGARRERRYWSADSAARPSARSDADWEAMTLAALRTAVERRMVADVPVGVLLSGGLDSSLIVGAARRRGPARARDVLDRLCRRRRSPRRRVSLLRPRGRGVRHRSHDRIEVDPRDCCRRSAPRSAR